MKGYKWYAALTATAMLLTTAWAAAGADLEAVPGTPPAEDFNLPGITGQHFRLADYKGKYVLVNFWAEWCSPCIREIPAMQRAYSALHGRQFEILAVHVGPAGDDTGSLLRKFGVGFPVLLDADLTLGKWKVQALPTSYLLDPRGRLIYWAQGAIDWDDSRSRTLLNHLLGSPPGTATSAPPL